MLLEKSMFKKSSLEKHLENVFLALISGYFITINILAVFALIVHPVDFLGLRTTDIIADPHAYDVVNFSLLFYFLYRKFGLSGFIPWLFITELSEMQWAITGLWWNMNYWNPPFLSPYVMALVFFLLGLFFMHWAGFRYDYMRQLPYLIFISLMMLYWQFTYPQGIWVELIWQILYVWSGYFMVKKL